MKGRLEHQLVAEHKIQELISNYPSYMLDYYYSLQECTHATKRKYIYNAIRFLDYVTQQFGSCQIDQMQKVTTSFINHYFNSIKYVQAEDDIKEVGGDAKACTYSSLKRLIDFLYASHSLSQNPFDTHMIAFPKIKEKEITFLTKEEIQLVEQKILHDETDSLSAARREKWKYRDYLIFRIPVVTGMRVTALNEINISDIDFQKNIISVIEKGNKARKIPFDAKTREYLLLWIKARNEILDGDRSVDALFISNRKIRMTVVSMENIIKKYTECIPGKHITPHKLRSTCATNLYQKSRDIYLVAEVLGHKSTAPTRRYAKVFDQNTRDAIDTLANMYDEEEV